MQVMAAADTADTSDTAAGFASMSLFWIILQLFFPPHILLPLHLSLQQSKFIL
jgi:hypothetical protein